MDWITLAQTFGPFVAALMIAIISGRRGDWVWKRELDACNAQLEEMRRDYEERLKSQRESHLQREAELAAASERWQKLFFEMLGPITSLAEVMARRTPGEPPP